MQALDSLHADLALRGAVAGLLLFHGVHLLLPGPRLAARGTLAGFVASVAAYLACQRPEMLLQLPRPLALALLTLTVGSAAWLWAAARAVFDDGFRFGWVEAVGVGGLVLLGLAGNLPYFPPGDGPFLQHAPGSAVALWALAHRVATVAFSMSRRWPRCCVAGRPTWWPRGAPPAAGWRSASACIRRWRWWSNWRCRTSPWAGCCRRFTWPASG
jgi:hypothetical protein